MPGPWTEADFRYQSEHVVTQKWHNSGHNCVASQVLILPADWDGSARMLRQIRQRIEVSEPRIAYYPGTEERLRALQQAEPAAEVLGGDARRLFVADVDPTVEHYGFGTEFFAPAMVTTSLPGEAGQFLQHAVDFCNDKLYGTLSVNLIVHPTTRRQLGADFDRAIAALRYGGIGINAWVGAAFLVARAAWSLPGSQLHRQSQSWKRFSVGPLAAWRRSTHAPPMASNWSRRAMHKLANDERTSIPSPLGMAPSPSENN